MADIVGATSIRYRPTADLVGKRLRLRVTGFNAAGESLTAYSDWTPEVTAGNTSARRAAILNNDPITYLPMDLDPNDVVAGHFISAPTGVTSPRLSDSYYAFDGTGLFSKPLDPTAVPRGADQATGRSWAETIRLTQRFTVEAWVRGSTPTVGGYETIVQLLSGFEGFSLKLFKTAGSTTCWVRTWLGTGTAQVLAQSNVTNLLNGAWHHIAARYNGTTLDLLVDKVVVASTAHTGGVSMVASATDVLTIGGVMEGGAPAQMFVGDIDDVAIYPLALTNGQLSTHADADATLTVGSDPVPWWPPRDSGASVTTSAIVNSMTRRSDTTTSLNPDSIDLDEFFGTLMVDAAPAAGERLAFWAMYVYCFDQFGTSLGFVQTGFQHNTGLASTRGLNAGGTDAAGVPLAGSAIVVETGTGAPTLDTAPTIPSTAPVEGEAYTATAADWTGETSVDRQWEWTLTPQSEATNPNTVNFNWTDDTAYDFRIWISGTNTVSISIDGALIRTITVPGVQRLGDPAVRVQDFRSYHHTATLATWSALGGIDSAAVEWFVDEVLATYEGGTYRHPFNNVATTGNAVQLRSPGTRTTTEGQALDLIGPADVAPVPAPTLVSLPTVTGTAREGQTLTGVTGDYNDETSIDSEWVRLSSSFAGGLASNFPGTITDTDVTTSTYLLDADDVEGYFAYRQTALNESGSLTVLSASVGPVTATPATVQPIVSDTFNRASSATSLGTSTSGHAWTQLHPRIIGVTSTPSGAGFIGQAYKASTALDETIAVVNAGTRNVRIQVDVTVGTGTNTDMGVALRCRGANTNVVVGLTKRSGVNRVAAYFHDTTWAGLGTDWTGAGLVDGQTYRLDVSLFDRNLIVRVDDVERITATLTTAQDTALTGAGDTRHGLRANNDPGTSSRWDNLAIYDVADLSGAPVVSPPTNDSLPVVTGTPQEGATVTATSGSWTGAVDVVGEWVQLSSSYAGGLASGYGGTVTALGDFDLSHTIAGASVGSHIAFREVGTNSGGSVTVISASIGPVTAAAAPPIVTDTFTRANSTTSLGTSTSGHAWTNLHGRVFGISSNQAYKATATEGETASVVNAGQRNVRLRANITIGATRADAGFALRAREADTYIIAGLTVRSGTNRAAIYTHINGAYTQLDEWANAGLVAGNTYLLEVVVNGTLIQLYVDGVLRCSATLTGTQDTALTGLNDTRHGLRASSEASVSRWDNFEIHAL